MIGQYLPQTNETCYSVLQEFKTLQRQIFHQLNKGPIRTCKSGGRWPGWPCEGCLRRLAVKRGVEKAEVGFSDLRGRCLFPVGGDMGGSGLLPGIGVGGQPFPD
jgi:hypothetical protein